ncbi:asparagine synthetase [Lophiotrema nucula]|uniref:Asparagine synthetase n=1 Tax=Lophiotrema nucula TaxID=690887 RepID=A0A6A5ZLT5_9PLEO|nr:asparagine synthetase [Lophiotrema nucula]
MKAFLAFGWEPEWDVQSILESGYISDTRTVFSGVKKIRAGHYLVLQGFENVTQQEYWEIDYPQKHQLGDAKDSTANINCYSIKFMDDEYDEEPIAQRTAEWLGVKMHVVRMTEDEFVKNYSDAAWHTEFPMLDLNFIGKVALSRLTRETGVKVILTGEGSDEQFAGYQNYLADFVREPDYATPNRQLPEDVRIAKSAEEDQPTTKSTLTKFPIANSPSTLKARRQVNNVSIVGITGFISFDSYFSQWTKDEHGTADPRGVVVHNSFSGTIRQKIMTSWHPLHASMYIWQRIFLANVLLTALGDRVEMSNSIEGRQPFLDHNLTEYVNGLPPTMKLRYDPETGAFNEKYILKEAARPFITDELYRRRKHPFSAPLKYEKNGPLHQYLGGLMTRENVEKLGFLDWEKCKGLVEDGFIKEDAAQIRRLFQITQLIEIGKRFGVKRARPEFAVEDEELGAPLELTQSRL